MFEKATNQQLQTIFKYERELCTPTMYKELTKELIKRGEFDFSMFQKATNQQLWVILTYDSSVRTEHLVGIIRELIRRDELKTYIQRLLKNQFKTITSAERATNFTERELTFLCYQFAINAIFEYKQGHGSFLDYYKFLVSNNLKALSYWSDNAKEIVS